MNEPTVHELKTAPIYFDAIARGDKLFEVRKNDRFFQCGDIVELIRLHEESNYYTPYTEKGGWKTGDKSKAQRLKFRIGPILQGGQFGIEPGYCVFSLLPITEQKP